jgi:release factor glutamine methyltransferase
VDERCLIPRPETELLAEEVIKISSKNTEVLDLCTGSGAIAIAVKKESDSTVCAIDISKDALSIAKENAELNNAEIEFIESNLFSGIIGRKFDVIVSNPPYIRSQDILTLQKEVEDFEPKIALDGGEDGLYFYKLIAKEVKNYLKEGGVLLLECGYDQARNVKELLTEAKSVEIIKDYENIERIVKAVF